MKTKNFPRAPAINEAGFVFHFAVLMIIVSLIMPVKPVYGVSDLLTEDCESANLPELNLDQAIEKALSDNQKLKMAEQAVEIARAAGRSALAAFFPDLNALYTYTRLKEAPKVEIPGMGEFPMGTKDNFRLALSFSYPLYNGGQDSATKRAARAGVESSMFQLEQAKLLLSVGITTGYTMVLEAKAALQARKKSLEQIKELYRVAKANFDAGYLPKSDLLSIEVALAQAQQSVAEMKRNLELGRSAFALAIGDDISKRWNLAPVEFPEVDVPFDLETLWEWALASRPELKALQAQKKALEAQMDAAKSARLPRINAQIDYSDSGSEFPLGGESGLTGGTSLSGTAAIFWDIFDFGRTDAILAPLKEQMEMLELQEADLKNQVLQEVESSYLNAKTQYGNLAVARAAVTQAEEAFRVAKMRQQAGLGLTLEVLNAESNLYQVETGLIHTQYEYFRSLGLLAQSLGMKTKDFLVLITADQGGGINQ